MTVLLACICMCSTCVPSVYTCQKRAQDPVDLELWMDGYEPPFECQGENRELLQER